MAIQTTKIKLRRGEEDKKKKEEEEKEETLFQKVTSQVGDYLFSLVVPVGILLYVAPQKSLTYIVNNAKEQVSALTELDIGMAWNATCDLVSRTQPLLVMEVEAVRDVAVQVPPFFTSVFQSEWVTIIQDYWEYATALLLVLAIIMSLFPWRRLIDWAAQSAWRTIMLFVGVLPLDTGLDEISDSDTGTYEIALVAGSVLLTLAINYVALLATWWVLKKVIVGCAGFLGNLISKQASRTWQITKVGVGKVFKREGKKVEKAEKVESKEE